MNKLFALNKDCFNQKGFERFILVANIGGEDSYFAVMGVLSKKVFEIVSKFHVKTNNIVQLHDFLNQVLEDAHHSYGVEISRAVIAGAGVVSRFRNKLKLNNHDLEFCVQDLKKYTLLLKFIFINTFEAEGFGIDFLDKDKISKISSEDVHVFGKSSLVIGAGHGLGASITSQDFVKHLRVPIPSEAGYVDFPVSCFFDLELMEFIRKKLFDEKNVPVSSESIISERGICLIYDFLVHKKIYGVPNFDMANLSVEEKVKFILDNDHDIYCRRAVELFVLFFARFSRNLALSCEPYSGLFLSGKMSVISEKIIRELFMVEFLNHSCHKNLLSKIPVFLVDDDNLVLFGACNVAINFYNSLH